jgi:hypothetical protein
MEGVPKGQGQKDTLQRMEAIGAPGFYPQVQVYLAGRFNAAEHTELYIKTIVL